MSCFFNFFKDINRCKRRRGKTGVYRLVDKMPVFESHVAASAGNVDYKTKKAQIRGTLATSEQFRQRVKREDGKQRNVTPIKLD